MINWLYADHDDDTYTNTHGITFARTVHVQDYNSCAIPIYRSMCYTTKSTKRCDRLYGPHSRRVPSFDNTGWVRHSQWLLRSRNTPNLFEDFACHSAQRDGFVVPNSSWDHGVGVRMIYNQ